MFKTILVPLDGSKRAERILPHVEALANKFGAKLVLVSIVEPILAGVSPYGNGSYYIAEELERRTTEANTYLTNLQATLSAKQLDVKLIVEYGPAVMTIQDIAEREAVDLVALASHGRTGLARAFYGSVAAGLLNRIDRPLLLIRAQD
ncbi:MAG: universal stress protein [Chloroflexi bacterium]|nr:universal stress protein [Chloroflexota bacterium]